MSDTNIDKPSLRHRIQYKVDNFFSGGGATIIVALLPLFAISFLVMGGIRVVLNLIYPDPLDENIAGISDQLWRVFLQIMDIGAITEENEAAYPNKFMGIVTSIAGLLLFSTMLAIFSSLFKEKLESLRKGNSAVIESGHTLILGFGNRALEIIRELIEANASERDAAVVVLAEEEKEVMDDYFRSNLLERESTRIITRTGSPSSHLVLKKLGVQRANSVIILNTAGPADPPNVKAQSDYRVLKSILAILATTGEGNTPQIVANLYFSRTRQMAEGILPGNICTIDDDTILAKILVQTSRISGLSLVYTDLVGFKGNEVYFSPIPSNLTKLSFGELQFHFKQSVPLGIRNADKQITLNPPPATMLQQGDEVVLLAEDDSAIVFYDTPPVVPNELNYSSKKFYLDVEKFLIIGWSTKSPILVEEYSSYIKDGSSIHVIVDKISPDIRNKFDRIASKYPGAELKLIEYDYMSPDFPGNVRPHEYDNVIILASDGNNAEEVDAETIFLLLKFRQYFREIEEKSGQPVTTQLVTEVMDSDNSDIIKQTGVRDFLISNQFVSKIMAQLSQEKDIKMVYDELFREEGSEIYLKSAELFLRDFPVQATFADLMLAAQKRNEICIGGKIAASGDDEGQNFGVQIIPCKDTLFHLQADDLLITLAENES